MCWEGKPIDYKDITPDSIRAMQGLATERIARAFPPGGGIPTATPFPGKRTAPVDPMMQQAMGIMSGFTNQNYQQPQAQTAGEAMGFNYTPQGYADSPADWWDARKKQETSRERDISRDADPDPDYEHPNTPQTIPSNIPDGATDITGWKLIKQTGVWGYFFSWKGTIHYITQDGAIHNTGSGPGTTTGGPGDIGGGV